MKELEEASKFLAIEKFKRNLRQERYSMLEEQIKQTYSNGSESSELLKKITEDEFAKLEQKEPVLDVLDIENVKSIEDFAAESLEKEKQTIIEIGESLKELIQKAAEDNYLVIDNNEETVDNQENDVQEDELQENIELEDEEENSTQKSFNSEQQMPKYFVISIGKDEDSPKIVIDLEGKEVGKINDGQFEPNKEYFYSKFEDLNIESYIASKEPNIQEQKKIIEAVIPKSIENLAEIDFSSGNEIIQRTNKIIENKEEEIEPQTQEKGIKDKVEDKQLDVDEEENKNNVENIEPEKDLDRIIEEKDPKKMEDYLEKNSSKKLIILIPYTLTDQLRNTNLKERGEPIIVYQLKGSVKPVYVLQQGDKIVYKDEYNSQIDKNMSKIPYTTGVVREVEDNETKATIVIDGKSTDVEIKGAPRDIDQNEKEYVKKMLEQYSAEYNRLINIEPSDGVDYLIEYPGGPEEKCQLLDRYEEMMNGICEKYQIEPPAILEQKANEKTIEEPSQETTDSSPKTLDDMIPGTRGPKYY